jgi:hypothetical protein
MGTIVENNTKNRIILTYHLPSTFSNPSNATRTTDNVAVRAQRIFVREFISYSSSPVFERDGDVERAERVWEPVYTITASVVAFEASTVLHQAVLSMVRGAELVLLEGCSGLTSLLNRGGLGRYGS